MSGFLAQCVALLNACANAVGRSLLAPLPSMPGWLSATIVASVTGVLLLLVFKYTSNQAAIQRVRNDINANLLAIKLFKDSTRVVLAAQGRMIMGALRLFVLAIVPMLIMTLPVLLLLGQLSLLYEHRPLRPGEEAVVALRLGGSVGEVMPDVELGGSSAAEVVTGPVRVPSKREVVWVVKARQNGSHQLAFHAQDQTVTKELAVGEGFIRVSPRRPGWEWYDSLLNPAEAALPPSSLIRSIDVAYPDRPSWTSGTSSWVIYWFVVSMIAAFCAKPFLKVRM